MIAHILPPGTNLHGRWLLLARVGLAAVAIMALAIVLFGVPSSFEHYRSVCTAPSEVCSERALDQPTQEGGRALRDVELSVGSYALLSVVIDKVFQLVWFTVGALIFWRRSDDRMSLLTSLFLVAFGTVTVDTTDADALVSSQPAWWLLVQSVDIVGAVCVVLFFLLFPNGRFVPRWTRWLGASPSLKPDSAEMAWRSFAGRFLSATPPATMELATTGSVGVTIAPMSTATHKR